MVLTGRRYTFDEWIDSPSNTPRSELVEGTPVERMATTPGHGDVVFALAEWLRGAQRAGLGRVVMGPVSVLLDAASGRRNACEPDVCFVRRDRASVITERAIEGAPDLVIEVLSAGNRDDDLPGGKVFRDYEWFGVPEYWVVDPVARAVTRYVRQGGQFVAVEQFAERDILATALYPGGGLALSGDEAAVSPRLGHK